MKTNVVFTALVLTAIMGVLFYLYPQQVGSIILGGIILSIIIASYENRKYKD